MRWLPYPVSLRWRSPICLQRLYGDFMVHLPTMVQRISALFDRLRQSRVTLPLALVALAGFIALLTIVYYREAYRPAVFGSDRIRGLFEGFYEVEGSGENAWRWTNGAGEFCLPAPGASRPPLVLQIELLGTGILAATGLNAPDEVSLRVAEQELSLPLGLNDRRYQWLLPPAEQGGPLCVSLESATIFPPDDGRVLGVAMRETSLRALPQGTWPPLSQFLVNLWLGIGGAWLLQRLGARWILALTGSALAVAVVGWGIVSEGLRVAPDLPRWSGLAGGALAALLGHEYLRQPIVRLPHAWQRELAGVALTSGLIGLGWWAMSTQISYGWPFPLMARPGSVFSWAILVPTALFVGWIALLYRWLKRETPPPAALAIGACWLVACLLAVSLKVSLRGWEELFQTYAIQPEDYINDVPLIGNDPLGFLARFVGLMPDLALHNRNHPPGSTMLLWIVERLIGPGATIAGWTTVILAGMGVWPTYRLAERLHGAQAGLMAAAIYGVIPAQLTYTAASMDAVFATIMAWAALYLTLALAPQGRWWHALVAGAWVGLGFFFTFGTAMLVLYVGGLLLWRLRGSLSSLRELIPQSAIVTGVVLGSFGLLYLVSGYHTFEAFFQGTENNFDEVQQRLPPPGPARYLFFVAANAIAFAWFLGPWLLWRFGGAARRGLRELVGGRAGLAEAVGAGSAIMLLGMLFSGLFTREVERIWMFSHILVASVAVNGIMREIDRRAQPLLIALLLITLFAHAAIFRATLRIYW